MAGGGEVAAEPMEADSDNVASKRQRARYGHNRVPSDGVYGHPEELDQSSETRERRHAAISILGDTELLTFHALASNESIPQARQRFLHHLIGIPPPTARPFAIQDVSRHRLDDMQHIYPRRPPQLHPKDAGAQKNSGNKSGYTTYEEAPTVVDIIEVNGGWEGNIDSQNKTKSVSASGSSRSGGGPSSSHTRVKGKGR
ncbi:hypothetical protein LOZ61_003551 [Ophidiomyces ophidiicola]|uniref:Uncharacterized protein n=1 Tax=Ophidiomyces ophidiicola TaxID=1387563 RepID=A0ACB8URF5_9EURO|nr:hypothetical protein LOZ61_003551 [Ophidiomyces ophidiicola]KAI1925559.1 hypothetical protein LOZ60_004073 [Ophidiomyces ophidiicola]KAI1926912.1 hypothetical protein LOZ64_000044 [Ophidiomyces ophidiicola]KAI1952517.1 hypothetical protein LOZ59_005322 [Ophidiomyces ophidiicola]KAI1969548.1 hypothetical protein LOZ56_004331 [Ophidiomyces ophidiicola]